MSPDCVPLGFLPRKVAKWVSPLYDVGFFDFFASVSRKQALAAALGRSNKKATLVIHVTQVKYRLITCLNPFFFFKSIIS